MAIVILCGLLFVDGDEHARRAAPLSAFWGRRARSHARQGNRRANQCRQSARGGWPGRCSGLGAAALFGASVPLAKFLLPATGAVMLAALLYLGAGLGVTVLSAVLRDVRGRRESGLRVRTGRCFSGSCCRVRWPVQCCYSSVSTGSPASQRPCS